MAKVTYEVLTALRNTIARIEKSNNYQWGHMGSCNCGFLAQEITHLGKDEIHRRAMQRYGDWNEQLNDYCPTSGLPMDDLISALIAHGFDADDLRHLEKLSDPQIIRSLPVEERNLQHNIKSDVLKYLGAWSRLIESKMVDVIDLRDLPMRSEKAVQFCEPESSISRR